MICPLIAPCSHSLAPDYMVEDYMMTVADYMIAEMADIAD
jgi:hypothetical protein